MDPNEALRKFEERQAQKQAEEKALETQEKAVAKEVGAEPETIELPPQLVYGVIIYELEDGSLGFQAMSGSAKVSLDQARGLAHRFLDRSQIIMLLQAIGTNVAPKSPTPLVKRLGVRRG